MRLDCMEHKHVLSAATSTLQALLITEVTWPTFPVGYWLAGAVWGMQTLPIKVLPGC